MIDKILGAIVGFGAASMFSKKSFAKGGYTKSGEYVTGDAIVAQHPQGHYIIIDQLSNQIGENFNTERDAYSYAREEGIDIKSFAKGGMNDERIGYDIVDYNLYDKADIVDVELDLIPTRKWHGDGYEGDVTFIFGDKPEKTFSGGHGANDYLYEYGIRINEKTYAKGGINKKYKVTSEINDDVEYFNTKKEVDSYINSELKLANVYEKRSPYTKDDFNITTL